MARQVDSRLTEVVALLPEDGSEISYDAWKAAINSAAISGGIGATVKAKRAGLVKFTVTRTENGDIIPNVSRVVEA